MGYQWLICGGNCRVRGFGLPGMQSHCCLHPCNYLTTIPPSPSSQITIIVPASPHFTKFLKSHFLWLAEVFFYTKNCEYLNVNILSRHFPNEVVNVDTVQLLKSSLDKFWSNISNQIWDMNGKLILLEVRLLNANHNSNPGGGPTRKCCLTGTVNRSECRD